jgi:hypothetical protein
MTALLLGHGHTTALTNSCFGINMKVESERRHRLTSRIPPGGRNAPFFLMMRHRKPPHCVAAMLSTTNLAGCSNQAITYRLGSFCGLGGHEPILHLLRAASSCARLSL